MRNLEYSNKEHRASACVYYNLFSVDLEKIEKKSQTHTKIKFEKCDGERENCDNRDEKCNDHNFCFFFLLFRRKSTIFRTSCFIFGLDLSFDARQKKRNENTKQNLPFLEWVLCIYRKLCQTVQMKRKEKKNRNFILSHFNSIL